MSPYGNMLIDGNLMEITMEIMVCTIAITILGEMIMGIFVGTENI